MNFFKKISFFWITLISLLLPGITVAVLRCTLRVTLERSDYYVETLADFDEFRDLARKDGMSLDELFSKLKENGVSSVVISEDTLSSLESEGKITVLTSKEIRKLSLDETFEIKLPTDSNTVGGLWVHSDDTKLLDRITQNLSLKLSDKALIRNHKNLLLINKSDNGIMNKVGLGFSKEYFDQNIEPIKDFSAYKLLGSPLFIFHLLKNISSYIKLYYKKGYMSLLKKKIKIFLHS